MRHIADQLLHSDSEGPCITIILPLLKEPGHADENAARLHRILDDVESKLEEFGLDGKAKGQYVASARNFADEQLKSPPADSTLILYVSSSVFQIYMLPQEMEESVSIGSHFYLTPLLSDEAEAMHYFVLAVSKKKATFFEVKGRSIMAREVEGMPSSVEDAFKGMEHTDRQVNFHSTGNGTAAFHGDGGEKDQQEIEMTVYLKAIANSLHTLVHEAKVPLVFAGVTEEYGIYKKFDQSGMLLDEFIKGNPDMTMKEDLLERSRPIAEKHMAGGRKQLAETFGTAMANQKGTDTMDDVLKAAVEGRVDTLLLKRGASEWGIVQENGDSIVHTAKENGDEDLLSVAASWTLRNGGNVVFFPEDEMPGKSPMAAIFRYSA